MLCPKCNSEMIQRYSPKTKKSFWGCSKFPKCKGLVPIEKGGGLKAIPQRSLKKITTPSVYQQAIFNWVENGSGNAIVMATAGSGKTTVCEHIVGMINKPGVEIVYTVFNSHVAREAKAKGLPAVTTHSLGLTAIREHLQKSPEIDGDKVSNFVKEMLERTWQQEGWMVPIVANVVSKFKNTFVPINFDQFSELVDRFGMEVNGSAERIFELSAKALEQSNKNLNVVDFDDMIYLPVKFKMDCKQYDWLLTDETQDFNRAQILLILKSVKPNGRVLAVGDKNQCQPAGTKVKIVTKSASRWSEIEFDEVDIENLKFGDEVLSYSAMYGCFINSGKITGISVREYNGRLIDIKTNKFSHKVTPNHLCVVKWNKKKIGNYPYIVYLMQKGDDFRIGVTRMWHESGSGLGIRVRLWVEKADKGWILSIFNSKEDAVVEEQFLSYRFGIPQMRFNGEDGYGYSQNLIDRTYSRLHSEINLKKRAIRCLKRYGRHIDCPFIISGEKKWRTFSRNSPQFKVKAANLIPEYMLIPEVTINKSLKFVEFNTNIIKYTGKLYGLNVDKHHTYVANNILTGNSMYGFRGADLEAMDRVKDALDAVELPLSITYRCPQTHVKLVNELFPEISFEPYSEAEEGTINMVSIDRMIGSVKSGDLVLSRINANLVSPVFTLIRNGRKAVIRGRDIGEGLIALVEKFKVSRTDELLEKLTEYERKEIGKLMKLEKYSQAESLKDRIDTIFAIADGTELVREIITKVREVFSDKDEGVVFSTVHRAKGDEANNTFILDPQLMPSSYAIKDWEQAQEKNIMFVALTRSKRSMTFVRGGPTGFNFSKKENEEIDNERK